MVLHETYYLFPVLLFVMRVIVHSQVSRKDAKVSLRRKENLRLCILILSALA